MEKGENGCDESRAFHKKKREKTHFQKGRWLHGELSTILLKGDGFTVSSVLFYSIKKLRRIDHCVVVIARIVMRLPFKDHL